MESRRPHAIAFIGHYPTYLLEGTAGFLFVREGRGVGSF